MSPRHRRALASVALTLAATAMLYALSRQTATAPCGLLLLVVVALAWPIWRDQREHALFERRAMLAGLTEAASRLRRWFWAGRLASVLQVFSALCWAALLLALAGLLDPLHWLVLAVDAAVLALLVGPVTDWLGREMRSGQAGRAARRWPLAWINMGLLGLMLFVVDFALVGAPDTRGLAWHQVADQAFLKVYAPATCALAGGLVGGLAALDALAWHAAEILIPGLPNPALKGAAWAIFLLQAGAIAFAVTRLQLGLLALLDEREAAPAAAESSRIFVVTVGVLLLLAVALTPTWRGFDPAALAARARQTIAWVNPCRTDPAQLATLQTRLDGQLQALRGRESSHLRGRADAAVEALFGEAEGRVDAYLDWYFTVLGEYQRLGAVLTGGYAEVMRRELERRVFGEAFGARLEQASREITAESQGRLGAAAKAFGGQLQAGLQASPCLRGEIDLAALGEIERDAWRASSAAFGGAGVAVAAGLMARRAATAATTRAASQRVFQGAASLAGRAVTKRSGTTLLAAASGAAVCGPLAPLCALAGGAVAWITFDQALIRIDELRFRDEMRAELIASLQAQKVELASQFRAQHEAALDQALVGLQQSVQRAFVPARETW